VTASRRSRGLAFAAACAVLCACAGPAALPAVSAIDPARLPVRVPDIADRTAARMAAAALSANASTGRRDVVRGLDSLRAIDQVLEASGDTPTGLVPAAWDLANATLGDRRAYRSASRALLAQDIDPALEKRIRAFREDSPLALADARIRDARQIEFGRVFNSLAEPAGRSIMNFSMAPVRFGKSLLSLAIQLYLAEPLPLQRRQALAHWKEYLARYPEDEGAGELRRRVDRAQAAWNRTYYQRMVGVAEQALDADQPRLALVYSDRALRYVPEEEEAEALRDEAERRLLEERARRRRSVSAPEPEDSVAAGRDLALALLAPGGDVAAASEALLAADPEGPLADEARFSRALALAEAGREDEAWVLLEDLADADAEDSNLARHAAALLRSPLQNPYADFTAARRRGLSRRARFALLGPWAEGPPRRGLPRALEWPLGLTVLPQVALGAPLRIVQLPWSPDKAADAAMVRAARRYLARHPEGEHAGELREWLIDFESGRDNWLAALALVEEARPDAAEEIEALREKAAEQSLQMALREERPELRLTMLRRVAREFPGTEASRTAGLQVREEVISATPHQIRLSKGFLLENPALVGLAGLALRPELLDGDATNGELHPLGVSFVGGNALELALVAPGGDEDDPPVRRRETLSSDHLGRAVALLEETTFRNGLVDPDAVVRPDANRDRYFEQARLGRADLVDPRPDAGARFTYLGMREKYGMVRSRESILPFDLVLQGSFDDLSLGAFPRIRKPRETPDAIFYR
jgi:hypothetical protein